jgi:hypothetical protein
MDPQMANLVQSELVLLANIHAQFQDCIMTPQGGFIGKPNEQLQQIMPGTYSYVPYKAMNAWDATTWWSNTTQQGTYGTNNTYNPRPLYTGGGV